MMSKHPSLIQKLKFFVRMQQLLFFKFHYDLLKNRIFKIFSLNSWSDTKQGSLIFLVIKLYAHSLWQFNSENKFKDKQKDDNNGTNSIGHKKHSNYSRSPEPIPHHVPQSIGHSFHFDLCFYHFYLWKFHAKQIKIKTGKTELFIFKVLYQVYQDCFRLLFWVNQRWKGNK